ncbi:MAG: molybdate ABC transporter substrate-binding protein [Oceanococcaceae bacterium]
MTDRTPLCVAGGVRRFPPRYWRVIGLLIMVFGHGPGGAQHDDTPLRIAVAANFAPVLATVAERFTAQGGHRVVWSAAASGALYAQIRQGAPFDIYLSADVMRPEKIHAAGLASGPVFGYATGVLVLYAPGQNIKDDIAEELARLGDGYLAMANPRIAPYGAAAQQVLDQIRSQRGELTLRTAMGSSIGAAFHFVATGNASHGFVALSQLHSMNPPADPANWRTVPGAGHAPLTQAGVVLARSTQLRASHAFRAFLLAPEQQQYIVDSGYAAPAGDS